MKFHPESKYQIFSALMLLSFLAKERHVQGHRPYSRGGFPDVVRGLFADERKLAGPAATKRELGARRVRRDYRRHRGVWLGVCSQQV